ncbi:MAG TPA: hypothetical protein VNL77_09315 [Roseiflexaceae bacterium]|nr:hypothetical protein [Roseiflexaceae bacterium]
MAESENLFLVTPAEGEPLDAAVERALASDASALAALPTLTDVAMGDPYLAEQLAALHRAWELRPPQAAGLLARLRTRLAWWLLGPEIRQINAVHATLVRLADSLVVLADQERAARRRMEEGLASGDPDGQPTR